MGSFNCLTRGYTLSMSILPFFVAFACAIQSPLFIDFNFFMNSIICLIGILAVHMAVNLYDDIFDIKSLLKKGVALEDIHFSNKRKACAILSGNYTFKQAELIFYLLIVLALGIGLYFIALRGWLIALIMMAAGFLSLFYPKSSKYGLSELVVGIVFGPLLVNSVYFALVGYFSQTLYELSFAIGIMTTILLITHSLMDYEEDKIKGKKTLPILLGNKNLTINVISLLILLSYSILFYEAGSSFINSPILAPVILSLPVSIKLILSLYDYIEIKNVQFTPKWYLGRMENWEEYKAIGLDYFMYRFYLSRNLATIFNLTLGIVCLFFFHTDFGHTIYYKVNGFIF